MEEVAKGLDITAQTLAQFLKNYGRYDGALQRYVFSNETEDNYETVILESLFTKIKKEQNLIIV
jgi:hypothetical protein